MPPSSSPLEVHLLDMGAKKFGDCILCRRGARAILIDGAHPGDQVGDGTMKSIPHQLADILGKGPPFHCDLLVVTHCHADHIGCLPSLIKTGTLTASVALVADETLGFGHRYGQRDEIDLSESEARVLAALREEAALGPLTDAAISQLIADAADLESNYHEMLGVLDRRGTQIIRYRGQNLPALEKAFRDFELKILGPTAAHLKLCADEIVRTQRAAARAIRRRRGSDPAQDEVSLFRSITNPRGNVDVLDGSARPGFALNNQSIVLAIGGYGRKALLTGDMQFADPQIKTLSQPMTRLRARIAAAGPFDWAKVAHHGSSNALDSETLGQFGARQLALSGGYNDPGHPEPSVLALLDAERQNVSWARTDRNGHIAVRIDKDGIKTLIDKGRLNDAQANRDIAISSVGVVEHREIQFSPATASDLIEIITRIPNRRTRLSLTIEVDPPTGVRVTSDENGGSTPANILPELKLFGGRMISDLVFVTDPTALARNIGAAEAKYVIETLSARGCTVLVNAFADVQPHGAATWVREHIPTSRPVRGIVLLGGYNVVPALRLSVVTQEERSRLNQKRRALDDPDDFVVWSDDAYGDTNGDGLPELPVSRVPDGQQAKFLFSQLSAAGVPTDGSERFGLRNLNRAFAESVYDVVPGSDPLKTSELVDPSSLGRLSSLPAHVYFMLHGADFDTSRFWGEYQNGRTLEACNVGNLPSNFSGVAFAGCCYGALIVEGKASTALGKIPSPIPVSRSMALSMLAAGATAFVGCTAAHYSPLDGELNHYGAPLHRRFWTNIAAARTPAEALHQAKLAFLPGIPHGPRGLVHVAIEKKVLFQFTCLGLGW